MVYNGAAMFENMIQLIEQHASYGPAMREVAEGQHQLVLNYHTHGGPTGYCVSIAKKRDSILTTARDSGSSAELVHIKGVGEEESQCIPLMSALGRELQQKYQLNHPPLVYLNGKPFSEPR